MPNTLTAIVPKILAMALLNLREFCMMPRLVNGDYSSDAAKFGSTIDVPVPQAQAVSDVTPSNTPPAASRHPPVSAGKQPMVRVAMPAPAVRLAP